jgi:hypothetical protein
MDSFLMYIPFVVNLVLLFVPKFTGKIVIGLISSILGSIAPVIIGAIALSGHGIGFGNPYIGIDWSVVRISAAMLAFLWVTFFIMVRS